MGGRDVGIGGGAMDRTSGHKPNPVIDWAATLTAIVAVPTPDTTTVSTTAPTHSPSATTAHQQTHGSLDLSSNRFEFEEDLVGLAEWPILSKVALHGNPVATKHRGLPPMLDRVLVAHRQAGLYSVSWFSVLLFSAARAAIPRTTPTRTHTHMSHSISPCSFRSQRGARLRLE